MLFRAQRNRDTYRRRERSHTLGSKLSGRQARSSGPVGRRDREDCSVLLQATSPTIKQRRRQVSVTTAIITCIRRRDKDTPGYLWRFQLCPRQWCVRIPVQWVCAARSSRFHVTSLRAVHYRGGATQVWSQERLRHCGRSPLDELHPKLPRCD